MNTIAISDIQRRLGELKTKQKVVSQDSDAYWKLNALMNRERVNLKEAYAQTGTTPPMPVKLTSVPKPTPPAAHVPFQVGPPAVQVGHAPFHFYAIPGSQCAAVLIDRIYTRWLAFHVFQRTQSVTRLQEYQQLIEGVIANILYAVALERPGVFVTRDQCTLAKSSRYRPDVYNQKLLTVLDDLHAMGMIEQVKGERWKRDQAAQFGFKARARQGGEPGYFNRTQLNPTSDLNDLRTTYQAIRPTDVLFRTEQQEVVIMKKDESSALLEYTDQEHPKAVKYRRQMQIIDRQLADAGDLLAADVPGVDQRQRFLVRKFTYSSLESGGRLWGGFWQNMPKVQRAALLRIHGQETVEIDYACVIVHLAYIVAQEEPPAGDLYHIPGLSQESRPGIKRLLPALLFKSKPATKYPQDVLEGFSVEDQRKPFRHVLELVKSKHPGIVHLFGTGIGHYLQFLESQLMVNVLLHCDRAGIVALPIHDCIMVAKDQEVWGRGMMERASLRFLGRAIPVK